MPYLSREHFHKCSIVILLTLSQSAFEQTWGKKILGLNPKSNTEKLGDRSLVSDLVFVTPLLCSKRMLIVPIYLTSEYSITVCNNLQYYIKYYKIQLGLQFTLGPQKFTRLKPAVWSMKIYYSMLLRYKQLNLSGGYWLICYRNNKNTLNIWVFFT